MLVGGTETLTVTGGTTPYTFSILNSSPVGKLTTSTSSTALYKGESTAGVDTVQVIDGAGKTIDATVTVVAVAPLVISPATILLHPGGTYTFHASGGVVPYTYTLSSGTGTGTLNTQSGAYTFPSSATSSTTANVTVTDNVGSTATASIADASSATFGVSPASPTVTEGGSYTLIAYGGTSPYLASVKPNNGSVSVASPAITYTASSGPGSDTVTVTDSAAGTTKVTINVLPSAASNLVATAAGGGAVNLTWTNNSAGASGVNVERATGTGAYATVNSALLAASTTTYQDTGLTAGTVYVYRIAAVKNGKSTQTSYSNESVVVAQ